MAQARSAAALIAERVTEPDLVQHALGLAEMQTRYPLTVRWDPGSVAQGDAGLALFCARLDEVIPEGGWADVGREHLARSATAVRQGHAGTGAIAGLSGLLFVTDALGPPPDLQSMRPKLRAEVADSALGAAARIRSQAGVTVSSYDLISGLSGVLLTVLPRGACQEPSSPLIPFLVRSLTELALAEGEIPAWHTPAAFLYDDEQRSLYPSGNLNCGLAHGIPGPLAALSLAIRTGSSDSRRVAEAVERMATWLMDHAVRSAQGPGWPTVVPLAHRDGLLVETSGQHVGRDAWCYGTPGVARALYLAGTALGEESWQTTAIEAMRGVYRRPPADRYIDSPTFCHGIAGLLQITLRFHDDTGLALFSEAATDLTGQVLAHVDPDRPMAVANLEPDGNPVDSPGLLDGATGVGLALLSVAGQTAPTWDRIMALS